MTTAKKPFFDPEEVTLISESMLKGAPEFEIKRFLIVCERTGLDPFTRQIYGRVQYSRVKRRGTQDQYDYVPSVVIMTSIDGLRSIAERTGEYRGQTKPEWMFMDESGKMAWQEVWTEVSPKFPDAARVGVHRLNFVEPCFGVARYLSYVQYANEREGNGPVQKKPTPFWLKMGDVMIAKCAEAIALRKAFPMLLGGIYIEEEVGREEPEAEEPTATATTDPDAIPTTVITKATATEAKEPEAPKEEPVKKTRKRNAAASETPAPSEPVEDKPKQPEPEPEPKEEPKPEPKSEEGWRGYVITHISLPQYNGKKLGELSAEEITTLKIGWADKYREKFKNNPQKAHEAMMLDLAHADLKK
jgi:phage recombination protein Bet